MDEQPVAELARSIIAHVAPNELPLFDPVSRAWFTNPKTRRLRAGGDEALGHGLADVVPMLTPFVLAATTKVADCLLEVMGKSLVNATKEALTKQVARVLRREVAPPPLSPAQISDIKDAVIKAAHAAGVPDQQSTLVADALVGHLTGPVPAAS